jgi:hypothetical protein
VNPADVRPFLADHPALVSLLLDLHPLLISEFSHAQLSLQVLRLAEVNQGTGHLLVQISTSLPHAEALDRLNRHAGTWLSTANRQAQQSLLLDVTSTMEPERAMALIEQYRRRFSHAYRRRFDVARRFLESPPDSDVRALAGAEISAALAQEQGLTLPGHGGDPREVLARLR